MKALLIVLLSCGVAIAQDCKVLKVEIADKYEGACKKGLAHGEGKAEGEDRYAGQFRKGLPHGAGKYTWANGDYYEGNFSRGQKEGEGILHRIINGRDSVQTGYWVDDTYVGAQRVAQYSIDMRRMIDNIRITKISEGNNIRFRFLQMGKQNPTIRGLYINSMGNGNINMAGADSMIENPTFPITIIVEYTSITSLGGNAQSARTEITINLPGVWQITFNNK